MNLSSPNPAVLRTYRNRLTNLTGRNRSLLLPTLPTEQFLDLHDADFLLNKPSFDIIRQVLSRKAAIPVCDLLDARNERVNTVSKRLRNIARTARFIEDERGTEDLYVGWPFVRGKFMDGTVVHGPLLFFPVNLESAGANWQLTRRGDDFAVLNASLALAYGHFNQVAIPEVVTEMDFADFDRDPLAFRTQLYEWLKTTPLEVDFNTDLFTDQLRPYDAQTTKSLTELERTGELKLYPEAVLGIFPQAGSFLVPDYDEMMRREKEEGEEHFAVAREIESGETAFSPVSPAMADRSTLSSSFLTERFVHTPLPLDASQEAAVRAVKAGESIVVQGPPGTGKSQLIANLMADAAAAGKRVLLVCQKRAALDVVYARLREVRMEPFVALIHDFQNDRKALYNQLAAQIAEVDQYKATNYSLDAVLPEREFDTESRRIDELLAELQAFKDALFDTSLCGLAVKELYLTSRPDAGTSAVLPDLSAVYQSFRFDELDGFSRKLTDYAAYQTRLGPDHSFAERVSFSSFSASALPAAGRVIRAIPEAARLVAAQTTALFIKPLTLNDLANWHGNAWSLTAMLTLANGPDADLRWPVSRYLLAHPNHPARTVDETLFTTTATDWEQVLSAPGPERSLPAGGVTAFRALLAEAQAARTSWVAWNWWQLTHPGKDTLLNVLNANGLTTVAADLAVLGDKVDRRLQHEAITQKTTPWLNLTPALPNEPASLTRLRQAREVADRLSELPLVNQVKPAVWATADQFSRAVATTLTVAEGVQNQRTDWQTYLTNEQIERVWTDEAVAQTLQTALRNDFDILVDMDRLKDQFLPAETEVINRLADTPPADWVRLFQNTLRLTWIEHIEREYPLLRSVSSLKMERMEQVLQTSVARKQDLSRGILLIKLREQTYKNLTFNRLNNLTTYRELQHQTTKKRNVWPVRKLMSQYADEVFRLVPCWLASPESVSAMFPLTAGLFDLVIFDEASQCFAENGLPAVVRGKQVVVAGDSQQLRPSDLYRIRLETNPVTGESDADPIPIELEVESLLELAAQSLPQVSLTGHYRSRSPELIDFSNEHFYGNKLTLLPNFADLSQPSGKASPAIRYHNVAGTWQQNTNPAEADAVVALIAQLTTELPGRSIGVVTFNYQQQHLIQEKLETPSSPLLPRPSASTGETTFVKNIENVQGDERDVIIFSVGYAPDERGKLAMQFGSLNARGGANRLNVAVTRARERIYVVTSLWPDQLNVEQSVNDGPKLLKAYLSYALSVSQGHFRSRPHPTDGFRPSALLKKQLAAQHPDWQPELPFADLTVLREGMYQSLVLTDDDLYVSQTPKEAHAYLPFALRARNWPFVRVWSREFWRGTPTPKGASLD